MVVVPQLHTIAQRPALSIVGDDGQPHTVWLADALKAQLAKVVAEGEGWPDSAEFKVEYQYHTWPMGWDKHHHTKYFDNRAELDAWMGEQIEWARCEDNRMFIRREQWDLGPNYLDEMEIG